MASIVGALQKQPFGEGLARHVQHILANNDPLARQEVLEADRQCVCLYDWVYGLITPLLNRPLREGAQADVANAADAAEVQEERDRAVVAVAEQEKEVARLRRKLREAVRSEQAGADFAAAHLPTVTASETSDVRNGSATGKEPEPIAAKYEVTGQKSLQYRLEEVNVPTMQEAVLHSLVKTLMEPRASSKGHVEIIGHSEDREAPETAKERAEAAQEWLLDHGVPAERLSLRWEVGGPAICRRTDLRLLEEPGADQAMRRRATELMKRIFTSKKGKELAPTSLEADLSKVPARTDEVNLRPEQCRADALMSQPSFQLDELLDSATQCRQLRLVFQKAF